jgi:sugar lactone lactonase YvrE
MLNGDWVESGWNKQLRKKASPPSVLTIESFTNLPTDASLCKNIGTFDRSLSADPGGDADLITIFNDGYNGNKGMNGVKEYLNKCMGLSFKCEKPVTISPGKFSGPYGVACDSANNVYVTDMRNHLVRKITPEGVVTTLAGSGTAGWQDGVGRSAMFSQPSGIAVAGDGTVYVSDYGTSRIRKITPSGNVTTLAGSGKNQRADGQGTDASFSKPTGLAIGPDGNLYVADTVNCAVRRITPSGYVTTLVGGKKKGYQDGTGADALLADPTGITVDSGNVIYVSEIGNNRIRRIAPSGEVTTLAGDGYGGNHPGSGHFSDGSGEGATFDAPLGMAVDAAGNMYVADTYNQRIRRLSPSGAATTLAGSKTSGAADGTGGAATFFRPSGVAVDKGGNVFVADQYNNRIRKITQAGVVTTFAGSAQPGKDDS